MTDEISDAFAHLTPEDLIRDTSATTRTLYSSAQQQYLVGRNNFNGFVDANLRNARESTFTDGGFSTVTVLHSPIEQRLFVPDDDETVVDYASRLTREAAQMKATWLFTAMVAPGRALGPGDTPSAIDADDEAEVLAALQSGVLHLAICWYSECLDERPVLRRSGVIRLDVDGHATDDEFEGTISADVNPFHHVMGNP